MHKRAVDQLGRIVLPQKIRSQLNISAGDELYITLEGDTIKLKKAQEDSRGKFKYQSNLQF